MRGTSSCSTSPSSSNQTRTLPHSRRPFASSVTSCVYVPRAPDHSARTLELGTVMWVCGYTWSGRGVNACVRACARARARLCSGVTLGWGSADLWQTLEIEREWLSRRLSRLAPTEAPGSRSTSGSTLGSASTGPSEEHETRPDYDAPPMPAHVRDGALAELLTAVHGSLVLQGKCSVSLGCADAINLKLFAALPQPPPVHLHEVPRPLSRAHTRRTTPTTPCTTICGHPCGPGEQASVEERAARTADRPLCSSRSASCGGGVQSRVGSGGRVGASHKRR